MADEVNFSEKENKETSLIRVAEHKDKQIENIWDIFFLIGPEVSDDFMNERAEQKLVKRDSF